MSQPHKKRKYRLQKDSSFLQVGFCFTYTLTDTHANSQNLMTGPLDDINK